MDTDKHGFKTGSSKMKRNAEKQRTRSGAERCSGQPEGLLEISRGLRSAAKIPPVHGETATTLKGSQSRAGVVCGAGTRSGCVILRDGFLYPRLISGIAPRCCTTSAARRNGTAICLA